MYFHFIDIRKFGYTLLFFISPYFFACNTSNKQNRVAELETRTRNDNWIILGAGGGGAMFYQTISPHNPDFVFTSCDMTGTYVTYNGGKNWRMFNLHGVVRFFVFDPVDSNTVYAHSIGLFRSTNRGNTWELIFPRPENVMGVVSKGDHADETFVTRDGFAGRMTALAIDPANSKYLYACIKENDAFFLYTSENGGASWSKSRELKIEVKNIFINPGSPANNRTLYIAGSQGILIRKNGEWQMNNGPEGVKSLTAFTAGYNDQQNHFVIYAISGKSYFNSNDDQSGIFITTDAGNTWENRQDGFLSYANANASLPEWKTIATSSDHPNVLYVSYNNFSFQNDSVGLGVARSEDYGRTWKLLWKDVKVGNEYFTSDNFKDGWLGERFGPSWGENPFSIGVSKTNPDIAFCGDFGRTISTWDGGKTWHQAYTNKVGTTGWKSRGLDVNTTYSIVFDAADSNHVLIPTTDIGLMESFDGGKSWRSATSQNGVPEHWVNTTYWLIFDPENKGKAWAVMSGYHDLPRPKMFRHTDPDEFTGGILVSENSGKSWKPVSSEIGEAAMTHIIFDPNSPEKSRTLYACAFGKGVYQSVDGGETWNKKNNGIEGKNPFAWRIERRDADGALFLVVCRRSDDGRIGDEYDGAIYVSYDQAANWTKIKLPEGTNGPTSLIPDPQQTGKLLLSAWGRLVEGKFAGDVGGGIFISDDDGKTWKQTLSVDQHISAVSIDKTNNRYYACGFNGSAYYSTDGNQWTRIKGYNFKWGQRVEPDPKDKNKIYVITYGGGVWHGPALGDSMATEDIITPIARTPSF